MGGSGCEKEIDPLRPLISASDIEVTEDVDDAEDEEASMEGGTVRRTRRDDRINGCGESVSAGLTEVVLGLAGSASISM